MVSIILPNLNTSISYLKERLDSIKNQTWSLWECIIIDGFSDNGSWEYIIQETKDDTRFRCYQYARRGIYNAINLGISKTNGDYIYIATSDDTCENNLLESLVSAIQSCPECSISHCCLKIIDDLGLPTEEQWVNWEKVKFYGDLITKYHIRLAPHDAIVHFGWSTVYTSLVQLLIKKSVFVETGLFNENFGAPADFEWGLRVSMKYNIVHVPLFLAKWRKHESQATSDKFHQTRPFFDLLIRMSQDAVKKAYKDDTIRLKNWTSLFFNYEFNKFNASQKGEKLQVLLSGVIKNPKIYSKIVWHLLIGKSFPRTTELLKAELSKRKLNNSMIILCKN